MAIPTDLSGLQLWLKSDTGLWQDAAGTVAATSTGHAIARWDDQSGNGRHATQTTSGNRPTLSTSVQYNGINSVEFTAATGHWLNLPNFMSGYTAGEVFAITKLRINQPTNTARTGYWRFGSEASGNINSHIRWTDGTTYERFGTTVRKEAIAVPDTLGNWFYYNVWSASNDYAVNVNQNARYTSASNTVGFTTAPAIGRGADAGLYFDGYWEELIFFNRKLSDVERADINAYLAARYGVTTRVTHEVLEAVVGGANTRVTHNVLEAVVTGANTRVTQDVLEVPSIYETDSRASQAVLEVATAGTGPSRSSQAVTEVAVAGTGPSRSSQAVLEVVVPVQGTARVTQALEEVLYEGTPDAQVTQAVEEVLYEGTPDAQVTQAVEEVLYAGTPDAQVTQLLVEALVPATSARDRTVDVNAVIRAATQRTTAANAAIRKTQTRTTSVDAFISRSSTRSASVNAVIEDTPSTAVVTTVPIVSAQGGFGAADVTNLPLGVVFGAGSSQAAVTGVPVLTVRSGANAATTVLPIVGVRSGALAAATGLGIITVRGASSGKASATTIPAIAVRSGAVAALTATPVIIVKTKIRRRQRGAVWTIG